MTTPRTLHIDSLDGNSVSFVVREDGFLVLSIDTPHDHLAVVLAADIVPQLRKWFDEPEGEV